MDAKNKPWLKAKNDVLSQIKNNEIKEIAERLLLGKVVQTNELTKKDEQGITAAGHLANLGKLNLTKDLAQAIDIKDVVKNAIEGDNWLLIAQLLTFQPKSTVKEMIEQKQFEALFDLIGNSGINYDMSVRVNIRELKAFDLAIKYIDSKDKANDKKEVLNSILNDNDYPYINKCELTAQYYLKYEKDDSLNTYLNGFLCYKEANVLLVARVLDKELGGNLNASALNKFLDPVHSNYPRDLAVKYAFIMGDASVRGMTMCDSVLFSKEEDSIKQNTLSIIGATVSALAGNSNSRVIIPADVISKIVFLVDKDVSADLSKILTHEWLKVVSQSQQQSSDKGRG